MYFRLCILLFLTFGSSSGFAHHSFSATFTDERKSTITGIVDRFSFRNPHVLVYIDVTNEDGSVTQWVSEGAAATNMRRRGWTARSIESGQLVRVSGDATHDGSPMTSIDYVEILDPETMTVVTRLSEDGPQDAYQPEVAENIPLRMDNGWPNLSAVWSNRGVRNTRPGQFVSVPLSSVGLAMQESFDISTDPQVFCDPVGLVRQVVTPHPHKISQFDDHVLIEYEEFGGSRKIYFDDRDHKGYKTHLGDSRARYEGGKLVIETINLLANQATNTGNYLSDQATSVETYSRADSERGTTLLLEWVISDPINLDENLVHTMRYLDQGNYEFIENDCKPPLRERVAVHPAMNFFLASDGLNDRDSNGGLEGSDAHCKALAAKVGQEDKDWVAYLSTAGEQDVNAKDRIAEIAPFYNAKGEVVGGHIDDLYNDEGLLTAATLVTEQGQGVNDRGDGLLYCFAKP